MATSSVRSWCRGEAEGGEGRGGGGGEGGEGRGGEGGDGRGESVRKMFVERKVCN